MKKSIDAIPRWRESSEAEIRTTFENASEDVQAEMNGVINKIVDEEQKKVAGVSGADKDAQLKKNLIARLNGVTQMMLENAQKNYSKDLVKLRTELTKMHDNKDLNPKEKFERQAIACWVKLMKLKLEGLKKEG
jgi:hypothetical protein